jgi:hypothetical protein
MRWLGVRVTSEWCWQVVAWSALVAGALLLAALFQAVLTAGIERAVQAESTSIHVSPATAALTDCQMIIGPPLYAGQNTRVTQTRWQCADPLP